jgi:hypothetical protein
VSTYLKLAILSSVEKTKKKKKIGNGPNRTELLLQILEYQLGIERECAAAVQVTNIHHTKFLRKKNPPDDKQ